VSLMVETRLRERVAVSRRDSRATRAPALPSALVRWQAPATA